MEGRIGTWNELMTSGGAAAQWLRGPVRRESTLVLFQ